MNLSFNLQAAIQESLEIAQQQRDEYVTLEHIVLCLLEDEETIELLEACGLDGLATLKDKLRQHIEASCPKLDDESSDSQWVIDLTLGARRVLQATVMQAAAADKKEANVGHFLACLLQEKDAYAAYFLKQHGIDRLRLLQVISHAPSSSQRSLPQARSESQGQARQEKTPKSRTPQALEAYTQELVSKAREGSLDPVIGREDLVERMILILARRTKNHPLLIGEPGVGKTALVHALAARIAQRQVPDFLRGCEIFALDMGALLAGTKYRGDFEARFKTVLDDLSEKGSKAILFIDEIHTVSGAGSTAGSSMDFVSMLKPALSSRQITCIGATTFKEYRSHLEGDQALMRRFQTLDVPAPNAEETFRILKGLKSKYETFHRVTYSDALLKHLVTLTDRYLPQRFQPDKSIDLLDEVGASLKVKNTGKLFRKVGLHDAQIVIAKMAQVPPESVAAREKKSLSDLEPRLAKMIFGQPDAISTISSAIKLSRSGLGSESKPMGSFLFHGPTGVGKTELCKQIATFLGMRLVRFDMSEYMEKHTVARLLGAPPGYVGYGEGGLLTDAVTQSPHCLLLLDEIEKAHPDISHVLLQVMDHGKLTDARGRAVDFRHALIVFTSNAGAKHMGKTKIGLGHTEAGPSLSREALNDYFAPEFLNRLTGIVAFHHLSPDTVRHIVDRELVAFSKQLLRKKISLRVSPFAKQWLLDNGYSRQYGARELQRIIDQHLKRRLADEVLFGKLNKGGVVNVDVQDGQLTFDVSQKVAEPVGA